MINADNMKIKQPCKTKLNVNDEYQLCVVRTQSFADFFIKASSSTEILLNPAQETIESLLESSLFSNKSSNLNLKPLLFNYFNITAEASTLCTNLLKTLIHIQSNHKIIDSIDLDLNHDILISDLRSSLIPNHHPFSDLNKHFFKHIQITHASLLHHLKSKRNKAAAKMKMIAFFNRSGIVKLGFLRGVVEQLDVAAKGVYILNRDFDTIGRLVGRIRDEIEHDREVMEMCLQRRRCLEMLKEMKRNELGLWRQAEELEEQVYVCLVTINRARAMVVKEICKNCVDNCSYIEL